MSSAIGFNLDQSKILHSGNMLIFCSEIFCSNQTTGEHLKTGERYYMPKLRETLQGVADQGPDYLYNGPITSQIVKELQARGKFDFCQMTKVKTCSGCKFL